MTGHRCIVCGSTKTSDPTVSFHRIPNETNKQAVWIENLDIVKDNIKDSSRVCSRHFPGGDTSKPPSVSYGKRFASPIKQGPELREQRRGMDSECYKNTAGHLSQFPDP